MTTLIIAATFALLSGGQSEDQLRLEEKKAERFRKVIEKSPDDPEACAALGRFLCLIKGSWDEGLALLVRGKDESLAQAARIDRGDVDPVDLKGSPLTGATFEVGAEAAPDVVRGDSWWDLSKKFRDTELLGALSRAIYWYERGMSKVDEAHRKKLKERMDRVREKCRSLVVRPGARVTDGCPKGWGVVVDKGQKIEGVAIDDGRSHSGRSSFRVRPCDHGMLVTERRPLKGTEFTASVWYMVEGVKASGLVSIWFIGSDDKLIEAAPLKTEADRGELPAWRRADLKVRAPAGAVFYRIHIDQPALSEGTLWVDDLSMKAVGADAELVQNSGFEER